MINARTGFFSPASKRSFRLLFVAFFPVCVPCVAGVLREIKVREYLSGGHEREALIAFSHASIPPSNSLQTCATQAMFCVEKNREMPLIVCLFRVIATSPLRFCPSFSLVRFTLSRPQIFVHERSGYKSCRFHVERPLFYSLDFGATS